MKSAFLEVQSGIDNSDLQRVAPSVFAEKPWDKVSARYSFLPTIEVVNAIKKETGLVPYSVRQSGTRIEGKEGYTKHMLRFRQPGSDSTPRIWKVGGIIPECILVNSHDRASAFVIGAGVYRLACLNGLLVSVGADSRYKVIHLAQTIETVLEAVTKVTNGFPQIVDRVARFQSVTLDLDKQHRLAELALGLRYEKDKSPFPFYRLLEKRRYQDDKNDLFTVINVIQENLLQGQPSSGRGFRGSRVVSSIDQNMKLNAGLWELAETFVK